MLDFHRPLASAHRRPHASYRIGAGRHARREAGFTLTELLVAIGIIALLIAILLPALSKALGKAKATQTQSTMQEFAKGCDAYFQEFGRYPGAVPEQILASDPKISGTENALLALMGGYVDQDDPLYGDASFSGANGWTVISFGTSPNAFDIKVNPLKVGDGPRVAGKQYPPFFAPKATEVAPAKHFTSVGGPGPIPDLPDLVDAWGQPILYVRAIRDTGPLVGAENIAQFSRRSTNPYLSGIVELGDLGKSQATSVLATGSDSQKDATLAQIIRSPAVGVGSAPLNGTARGRYVIISAGPDGIFFSSEQVRTAGGAPLLDIVAQSTNPAGPDLVKSYDDIIVAGGG